MFNLLTYNNTFIYIIIVLEQTFCNLTLGIGTPLIVKMISNI